MSVKKGSVLKEGSFNTNFGHKDTGFDILWTGTEDIKDDGEIFILKIKFVSEKKDSSEIKINYSPDDTFNSMWEDVKLECKNIKIKKVKQSVTTAPQATGQSNNVEEAEIIAPSASQVVQAAQRALKDEKADSVYETKKNDSFLKSFNSNLTDMVGEKKDWAADYDSFKQMYNGAYESEFFNKISEIKSDDLSNAISSVMQDMGISNIKEVPEEKQEEFVKKVQKQMNKLSDDMPDLENEVDTKEAMKLVKQAYGVSSGGVPEEVEITKENGNRLWLYVTLSAVVIVVIAVMIIIIIKKRKGENKK